MLKKTFFGVSLLMVVLADAIVPRGCAKRPERPLPPPPEPSAVEENAAQKPSQTAGAPFWRMSRVASKMWHA
ncbi:MAG: hypothetical protein MJ240_03460 [Kiritimatiellae bacterium]|nr:hypothetical protein [Kiritimatiellia bacterium]